MGPRIHDAKSCFLLRQSQRQFAIRQFLEPAHLHSLQRMKKRHGVWNDRANIFKSKLKILAMFERRLRRRAKYDGAAVIEHQLAQRSQRGFE